MSNPLRVLSLYDGFFSGGARILHTEVVRGLHARGQLHSVLSINWSMTRESTVQPMQRDISYRKLIESGITVRTLGRNTSTGNERLYSLTELALAKAMMEEADVIMVLKEQPLDLLMQAGVPHKPIIVCLHRSDPERQSQSEDELIAAMASSEIGAITTPGVSARDAYARAGIPLSKIHAISNGVDLRRFRPSRYLRRMTREAFGIPQDAAVIVFAARYDAMKNIPLFLASAAIFLAQNPTAHIIMAGAGIIGDNPALMVDIQLAFAGNFSIMPRLHLAGLQAKMKRIYAAADVISLTSSFGEAYPLSLVEGLSCGAVPVSTVVGDTQEIMGDRGLITPSEPISIAAAWYEAIQRRRYFLKRIAFSRDEFKDTHMLDRYEHILLELVRKHDASPELTTAFGDVDL